MPIRDAPGKITQSTAIGQVIAIGVRFLKTGQELRPQRLKVNGFVFGKGVLVDELIYQGVKRLGITQVGVVHQGRPVRLDQVYALLAAAVKGERVGVQIDHRVASRQGDHLFVAGEKQPVRAEVLRETLLVVGRVNQQFAAHNFAVMSRVAADFGGGVGG